MQLAASKDTESDLLQRLDLLSKDNDELVTKVNNLQEDLEDAEKTDNKDNNELYNEMEKMKKLLHTEKMLKQQAVNKLAEIMNRKDNLSRKDRKEQSKASSAELKKKEKENRKLQQDLTVEKEKFNQVVAKYEKDTQDLQVSQIFIYRNSQKHESTLFHTYVLNEFSCTTKYFWKILKEVGSSHIYASFATFWVQIDQLFEAQWDFKLSEKFEIDLISKKWPIGRKRCQKKR